MLVMFHIGLKTFVLICALGLNMKQPIYLESVTWTPSNKAQFIQRPKSTRKLYKREYVWNLFNVALNL